MRAILIFICFLFLPGCVLDNSPFDTSLEDSSSVSSVTEEPTGLVPEPTIDSSNISIISTLQTQDGRSMKLSGMVEDLDQSSFYINDQIIFSNETESDHDTNIQFTISTHCIVSSATSSAKNFTKKITMEYKDKIRLLELLPEEIFIYGDKWWEDQQTTLPTCGFQFVATNKNGDTHFFSLPHLPVASFEDSLTVSLTKELTIYSDPLEIDSVNQFPMLVFHPNKKLEGYRVLSALETQVDQLKLICEHTDFSIPVSDVKSYQLQDIPGLSTTLTQTSLVTKSETSDNLLLQHQISSQPCRF